MDKYFPEYIANEVNLTLWDKALNQLHTPYAADNWEPKLSN